MFVTKEENNCRRKTNSIQQSANTAVKLCCTRRSPLSSFKSPHIPRFVLISAASCEPPSD